MRAFTRTCPLSDLAGPISREICSCGKQDINRKYDTVLDLGAHACNLARAFTLPNPDPDPSKPATAPISTRVKHLTCAESSATLLHRDASHPFNDQTDMQISRTVLSAPETLPFAPSSFDAVVSNLSLHWVNDLPSVLAQVHAALRPDAPFLAAMLGGDSLYELRTSLQLASLERRGGVAPHTSPLADVRDVGGLLQRAGFRLLTVDVDDVVVEYPSATALMTDLQAMGESSALAGREMGPIGRDVLLAAEAIYRELHGEGGVRRRGGLDGMDADDRVREGRGFVDVGGTERRTGREEDAGEEAGVLPATFRVIWMIGWKPGPGQQDPLQRGSGMLSIKDILEGGDGKGEGKK